MACCSLNTFVAVGSLCSGSMMNKTTKSRLACNSAILFEALPATTLHTHNVQEEGADADFTELVKVVEKAAHLELKS